MFCVLFNENLKNIKQLQKTLHLRTCRKILIQRGLGAYLGSSWRAFGEEGVVEEEDDPTAMEALLEEFEA